MFALPLMAAAQTPTQSTGRSYVIRELTRVSFVMKGGTIYKQ